VASAEPTEAAGAAMSRKLSIPPGFDFELRQ